jgi:putative ABC transport system permease protein
VILTVGAGLLIRSAGKLRAIDPGADLDAVAVLDVSVPARMTAGDRLRTHADALAALQALPGVQAVGATQRLPLRGGGDNWGVRIPGHPEFDGQTTFMRIVTADYFRALGIDVRKGRGFLAVDAGSTQRLVVVNEAFAAKFFPSEDPLDRRVNASPDDPGERIIGVVENVAEGRLTDAAAPTRYMLFEHIGDDVRAGATIVLRATSPAGVPSLLQEARNTLQRNVPRMAVNEITTMQAVFDRAVGPTGQVVTVVSMLAGLALALGAIGIYGVMTQFVSRRLRDYGICIMLGLAPARVLTQVVRQGVVMVAAGSLIGVIAAAVLTRLLTSLLYQVAPIDPPAFAGAALTLLLAGAVAALIPALRASSTDPAELLRQE